MPLHESVAEAFAPEGVLSQTQTHFQPRQGQTQMALAVAETIAQGGALVVEAGTGIGKTFAYLVPALLSGERVLVSTATKALQDQLFTRDLPVLVQALGLPLRTALLKLFEDNASTLTPDPVYVKFYYSHPPASERLLRMPLPAHKPAPTFTATL